MYFWILLLFSPTAHSISLISEPRLPLRALNFAKPIEGRKLNGSVIREVEVDSELSCQFECVGEGLCLSYNVGRSKTNAERFVCQLSDSDRFSGHVNFTEDEGFKYGGLQSVCEASKLRCGDREVCIPNYQNSSVRCECKEGYTGKPYMPKSCAQFLQDGFTSSGVYTINPDGGKPIPALCDMNTDGGGWTVFQRRLDGSVDFYRDWASYKIGFGDLNGEFWLGNDNLHRLTASDDFMLRVDLEDFEGNITYAEYTTFKVADEGDKYRLLIGGYSGTAGDSMTVAGNQLHSGMQFTTKDQDSDMNSSDNCAQKYKGAWWYNACHRANLNGLYLGGLHDSFANGINWHAWRGNYYSLKRAEMKIKPAT